MGNANKEFWKRCFVDRVVSCTCNSCPIQWYCQYWYDSLMTCREVANRFIRKAEPSTTDLIDLIERSYEYVE